VKKQETYKWIKIGGMLSFLPIILAAGPLFGYFTGSFLKEKFGLPEYILFICIGIGFLASIKEVIRIIKIVSKIEK